MTATFIGHVKTEQNLTKMICHVAMGLWVDERLLDENERNDGHGGDVEIVQWKH